ncbi:hypothetical protein [Streptomyces sp. NPDC058674]|uniref:hypothetical protein n=1 Tax=Streptomyces sp. NPDC058674 TaxID=3346592 RepID=UPI003664B98B
MKLNKRLAAVAAAAVVGPTVLMSTPAMADEAAQPAVTVPDTEPKGDAEPGGTPEAAHGAAPAVTAGPEAEQTEPRKAESRKPAGPKSEQRTPAGQQASPAAGKTSDDDLFDQPTGILMGPEVTVHGIPKDGFKKGGSWTKLTVEVDNAGHRAVPNYTPTIHVVEWDGAFTSSQVKVERLVGGAWQPVKAVTGEALGPGLRYPLGATASVAAEANYTVDVRISFAADTPALPFELYADGVSRDGSRVSASPASWYQTKIEGAADGGEEQPTVIEGPALTVSGVPASITAGGGWAQVTVRVDNAGKDAQKAFDLGMTVSHLDRSGMSRDQIQVEVYSKDENGVLGWHPTEDRTGERDDFAYQLASGPIGSGKAFDVQVRIRVSAQAPTGDVSIRVWGSGPYDEESHSLVLSRSKARLTKIVAPTTNNGGGTGGNGSGTGTGENTGGTGNEPKPDGGMTPIDTDTDTSTGAGTGTGTGTGGSTGNGSAPSGGELAATGTDPATSWALGGAGVAVAMGAALIAGTGRRRRTTA